MPTAHSSLPSAADEELFVDFSASGHHPEYLGHLFRAGGPRNFLGSAELWEKAVAYAGVEPRAQKWLVDEAQYHQPGRRVELVTEIMRKNPQLTSAFFMHFDFICVHLLKLALARPKKIAASRRFGGLIFRNDVIYTPSPIRRIAEDWCWRILMRHCCFGKFRFLDKDMARRYREEANYIADPIPPHRVRLPGTTSKASTRQQIRVLFFGHQNKRKNATWGLRALRTAEFPIHVTVAGRIEQGTALADEIRRSRSTFPVSVRNDIASEDQVVDLFLNADVVALPYWKFYRSSGVLLSAVATGVPVVCPGYGWMGRFVRERGVGSVYEASDVEGFAQAVHRASRLRVADTERIKIVQEHSAQAFARSLLQAP